MRWFRANKTFGSRLALFALAVQFVLAFGHIHHEDIYGSARPVAAIAAARAGRQPAAPGQSSVEARRRLLRHLCHRFVARQFVRRRGADLAAAGRLACDRAVRPRGGYFHRAAPRRVPIPRTACSLTAGWCWASASLALFASVSAGDGRKLNAAAFPRSRFAATARPPTRRPVVMLAFGIKCHVCSSHAAVAPICSSGSALLALLELGGAALAQVALPEIAVTSSREKPKPRPVARPAASAPVVAPLTPAEQALAKNNAFDQSRSNLYTTIGTTSSTQTHATIDALPQGTNRPVEKVLLQAPGVSQDSAASGSLHVRNDHANLQFRINGVMLPDGVTGFGSFLDTSLDRQHRARHRRAAGRVRPAHGRPGRHHDARRRVQQFRQRQPLRRQPRHHHAEFRIWRHLRRQLSDNGVVTP